MAGQTIFSVPSGTWYSGSGPEASDLSLHLIQQRVEVLPALPKMTMVDVPGTNGQDDLTESLGFGVTYQLRTLRWTFALYPGMDWDATRSRVSNVLAGQAGTATLDTDPDWTWKGRFLVVQHTSDRILHQITVELLAYPYKRRFRNERFMLNPGVASEITVQTGAEWVTPRLVLYRTTEITFDGRMSVYPAGTYYLPEMYSRGSVSFTARSTSSTSIAVQWEEGSL